MHLISGGMVGTFFFFLNQKSKCGPTIFCKILYDLWNVQQILLVNDLGIVTNAWL